MKRIMALWILVGLSAILFVQGCSNDKDPGLNGTSGLPTDPNVAATVTCTDYEIKQFIFDVNCETGMINVETYGAGATVKLFYSISGSPYQMIDLSVNPLDPRFYSAEFTLTIPPSGPNTINYFIYSIPPSQSGCPVDEEQSSFTWNAYVEPIILDGNISAERDQVNGLCTVTWKEEWAYYAKRKIIWGYHPDNLIYTAQGPTGSIPWDPPRGGYWTEVEFPYDITQSCIYYKIIAHPFCDNPDYTFVSGLKEKHIAASLVGTVQVQLNTVTCEYIFSWNTDVAGNSVLRYFKNGEWHEIVQDTYPNYVLVHQVRMDATLFNVGVQFEWEVNSATFCEDLGILDAGIITRAACNSGGGGKKDPNNP